jgi:LCP family protein required for cell wall assembly
MAMHAVPAFYGVKAVETVQSVSLGGDSGGEGVRDRFFIIPGSSGGRLPTPSDRPDLEAGERVNVLLVGIDELPNRTDTLTDTMLVVSLDPDSGESSMLSVPRDLYGAPLPGGGTYDAKLNSLMAAAGSDPVNYPEGGVGALKATISELLGVPIDYFAAINLLGFKDAVDAIGGIDITVQRSISDASYTDEYNRQTGFYIDPGTYHMDGHMALGYVRSRFGPGDDDFVRAARQQQVLTAIREKLTAGNLLTTLPAVLDAVQNTIATDVPEDHFSELAQAVQEADVSRLERAVIEPPDYVTPSTAADGAYILVPDIAAIRRLADDLMGS